MRIVSVSAGFREVCEGMVTRGFMACLLAASLAGKVGPARVTVCVTSRSLPRPALITRAVTRHAGRVLVKHHHTKTEEVSK